MYQYVIEKSQGQRDILAGGFALVSVVLHLHSFEPNYNNRLLSTNFNEIDIYSPYIGSRNRLPVWFPTVAGEAFLAIVQM